VTDPVAISLDCAALFAPPAASGPQPAWPGAPPDRAGLDDVEPAGDVFTNLLALFSGPGFAAQGAELLPPGGQNLPLPPAVDPTAAVLRAPTTPAVATSEHASLMTLLLQSELPAAAGAQTAADPGAAAALALPAAPSGAAPLAPSAGALPGDVAMLLNNSAGAPPLTAPAEIASPSAAVTAAATPEAGALYQSLAGALRSQPKASAIINSAQVNSAQGAARSDAPAPGDGIAFALGGDAGRATAVTTAPQGSQLLLEAVRFGTRELQAGDTGEIAPSANPMPLAATQAGAPRAAAASVLADPTLATTPERFGEALAHRIEWMVDHQLGEARIKLNPPELGALDIKISMLNDRTHIQFTAAHHSAREAIEAAMPRLKDLLAAGGLELGSASVAGGGAQSGSSHSASSMPSAPQVSEFAGLDLSELPPLAQVPRAARGAVDLYA
jgi:flagellar hook-length control protein FliK